MAKKRKTDGRPDGPVKTHRFEIIWDAAFKETAPRWRELADLCRELANYTWQEWESRHIACGNHRLIRQWMADFKAARQAKQAPPKCPVPIEPPTWEVIRGEVEAGKPRPIGANGKPKKRGAGEDGETTYLACSRLFTEVDTTLITLLQQTIKQRMTGKDADGTWNMWQAVLAGRQGRPSAERDQPIPFSLSAMQRELVAA